MVSQKTQASLSEQAYEQIKHKIVTLALAPGSVIDEAQLRKELGLGRTPIREALKRLSLEKLVTILPRRGMFVTEIGITDLKQLFEIRLNLECLAARLAARRGTAAHWQEMQEALDSVPQHNAVYPQQLIDIDETCHQIIYKAANNTFLRDTLSSLYALTLRLWHLYFSQLDGNNNIVEYKHIVEHQHILQVLEAGDSNLAEELMANHIQAYYEDIQAVMLGNVPSTN